MTVAELIELLRKEDPERTVVCWPYDGQQSPSDAKEVRTIEERELHLRGDSWTTEKLPMLLIDCD